MDVLDLGAYPGKYPTGSIFWSEGKKLYDLVIEHKPKRIIEVGTRWGASTQFLALGCLHNGFGEVHTYDVVNLYKGHNPELDKHIFFHHHDYFEEQNKVCDLLFEDGAHSVGFTSRALNETTAKTIAVHDFLHWDCIKTVKEEAINVLGEPNEVFIEDPSDCGLAIWYK